MRALLLALPGLLWASSAAAKPEWSADVGVVSDYRFRGIDLSRGRPAVQASLSIEDSSGFYGQVWTSTLGHGSHTELDFSGGYDAEISDQLSLDASANLYTYPSGSDPNYVELTGSASFTRGPASAKLELSYVPPQGRTHANTYVSTEASYDIPKTPVSLSATLGYERGWFDEVEHGGKWDWTVGAEVALKPAKLCLNYVGSNADGGDRHALVAAAFVSF
jgi:uncharacterized protein (TIGR02001 family)